ncbi:APC family permease [Rhabdochromatium marinum]|uniref:APC family permease n=1 Tax=Rhabdochromatium marinum TaxID=48729 RepID=UPI001A911DEE|nr:amino acid permease [Rhabdochromatium marinum]MBK1649681.1 amino acid permease [Rhabdochromatium marinum]
MSRPEPLASSQSDQPQKLARRIGLISATVLVVANMVGTGIFTTSGLILAELGSPTALLLCWLLGGLFALTGALCYAELGAMLPRAGGEYVYLRESFGPLPAFISGWISLIVGFSAPIAAAAIAFATYLLGANQPDWPIIEIGGQTLVSVSPITALACAAVILLSLAHYHSLQMGQGMQNLLTSFKIGLILTFIIGGFWFGEASIRPVIADSTTMPSGGQLAVALIFISFAYSGWNAAAYVGGEIRQPERNLPLALIIGTLLVILLYVLLNLTYLYALPVSAMAGVLDVGTAAATALFGGEIGRLFGIAIAVGLLSVISAMIMAGPRVYYAMARDGLFFRRFGRVHEVRETPAQAILFQGAIAVGMILVAAYDALLIYIGFTLSLMAMLTVLGLIALRRSQPKRPRPYRVLGYPFTPWLFIAGNLWIAIYTIVNRPMAGIVGVATLALGAILYQLFSNKPTEIRAAAAPD